MTLSEALKKRIMDLADERKMSLHKLTTVSGVAYSTLSSFFLGKCSSLTLTTILHICEGLNIKLKESNITNQQLKEYVSEMAYNLSQIVKSDTMDLVLSCRI